MEYLVEWACGTFTVMTAEKLAHDIAEWMDGWKKNPRPVYRLVPGQAPKRYTVKFVKNSWYLTDGYNNLLIL